MADSAESTFKAAQAAYDDAATVAANAYVAMNEAQTAYQSAADALTVAKRNYDNALADWDSQRHDAKAQNRPST